MHSGFGISGLVWLIAFTGQATREHVTTRKVSLATIIVTYIILSLLLVMVTFAYPTIRKKFHNNFEATHRFLGWTATGLVWAQVVLLTNDYKEPTQPLGRALVHAPSLCDSCCATCTSSRLPGGDNPLEYLLHTH